MFRAEAVRRLRVLIDQQKQALHQAAAKLPPEEEEDGSEIQPALDRALIIQDEKLARLYLRYASEARSAFHRALTVRINSSKRGSDRRLAKNGSRVERSG